MRFFWIVLVSIGLFIAAPASAETVEERVVRDLRAQGFQDISGARTFLGRIRFVAKAPGVRREVVVNPRTGEILRDFTRVSNDSDREHSETPRSVGKKIGDTRAGGLDGSGNGSGPVDTGVGSDHAHEKDGVEDEDDDKDEREDDEDSGNDRDAEDEDDEDDEDEEDDAEGDAEDEEDEKDEKDDDDG